MSTESANLIEREERVILSWETIFKTVFMSAAYFALSLSIVSVYLASVDYNNHYYYKISNVIFGDNQPFMAIDHPHYPIANQLYAPTGPYPYTLEFVMLSLAVVVTALAGLSLLIAYRRADSANLFVVAYLFGVPFSYFVFLGNNFDNYDTDRAYLAITMFALVVLASFTILQMAGDVSRRSRVKQWVERPWVQRSLVVIKVLMVVYLVHNLVIFGWMHLFYNPLHLLREVWFG